MALANELLDAVGCLHRVALAAAVLGIVVVEPHRLQADEADLPDTVLAVDAHADRVAVVDRHRPRGPEVTHRTALAGPDARCHVRARLRGGRGPRAREDEQNVCEKQTTHEGTRGHGLRT